MGFIKQNSIRKPSWQCVFFITISMIVISAVVSKAFFGMDWSDETYYAALSNRIAMGDVPFREIWDIHQTSAFLTAPIIFFYRQFTGGTAGIVLYLRFIYLIAQGMIAAFTFYAFKKQCSVFLSAVTALCVFIFAPFSIAAPSYNTMAASFLWCALLPLIDILSQDNNKINIRKNPTGKLFSLSGFFFALCVFAYPGMILCAVPLLPCFVLSCKISGCKTWKAALWCFSGIAVIALPLVFYFLFKTGFHDIIAFIPRLFGEESHDESAKSAFLLNYFQDLKKALRLPYLFLSSAALFLILRYTGHKRLSLYFISAFAAAYLIIIAYRLYQTGLPASANLFVLHAALFAPLIFAAFPRETTKPFLLIWLPSLFASLAVYLCSNNRINGASYPFFIGMMAIPIMLSFAFDACRNCNNENADINKNGITNLFDLDKFFLYNKKNRVRTVSALAFVFLICLFVFRIGIVYRDGNLPKLNTQLKTGPCTGIYTTAQNAAVYSKLISDINSDVSGKDRILFIQCAPYAYLVAGRCSSHTVWYTHPESVRLLDYYRLNPAKKPDKIIIFNESVGFNNRMSGDSLPVMDFITKNYKAVSEKQYYTLYVKISLK